MVAGLLDAKSQQGARAGARQEAREGAKEEARERHAKGEVLPKAQIESADDAKSR